MTLITPFLAASWLQKIIRTLFSSIFILCVGFAFILTSPVYIMESISDKLHEKTVLHHNHK